MTKYINDAEEPQFLFEANYIQFEQIHTKMAQMDEIIIQMNNRMKKQDELIEALYAKQADEKVLKKEIKLLKENLVNQSELIDEINNLKEDMKKKKDKPESHNLFS